MSSDVVGVAAGLCLISLIGTILALCCLVLTLRFDNEGD